MNGILTETRRVFSPRNIVSYLLGLMGLSVLAVTQFVAELLPLLFAPLVCGTFGVLLYASKTLNEQSSLRVGPAPNAVQE
jgi:hypothetical protein